MVTIPAELKHVLSSDPEMLGGAVCFTGIRVPVRCLLDTIMEGGTLEEFMDGWPGVPRESAEAVLLWQGKMASEYFEMAS